MAKKTKGNLSLVTDGETSTIKLYGKDANGRRRTAILKATAIDLPGNDTYQHPTSQADEPDPFQAKRFGKHKIINPRYPLAHLTALKENSTELGQCINSMVTNTVGFGYQLRERRMSEKERVKFADEIEKERAFLTAMLDTVHPTKSFTTLRWEAKDDQHSNGNGYLELIDHPKNGELAAVNYVRSYEVRLTEQDNRPTKLLVPWVNPYKNFTIETKPMHYRFRKFVMLRRNKPIWFREAGDPRILNKRTGEYDEDTKPGMQATSLLHFKIHSSLSAYGIVLWIGNLFSIYGSRSADELNWTSLKNNMIPSMFVVVENGVLTEASITRLREWTEQQVANSLNRSKFLILEGETLEEGAPTPANFKIRVEPLAQMQKDDQLFQDYDKNNRDKIRQAFRLPPLFIGRCMSEDTEFLTDNGWKLYGDIDDNAKLATFSTTTGEIEYQKATRRHEYAFDGKLLHLKNRGVDALVTPSHRMWTKAATAAKQKEKDWDFVEAQYLEDIKGKLGGCVELPVSADWAGEEVATFVIPGGCRVNGWDPSKPTKNRVRDEERYERAKKQYRDREVPMDVFLAFLGYFVSEGSTTYIRGPITLSQNSGDSANNMISCFKELGFDPGIVESRPDELNISICHGGLWEWLRENCGDGCKEKRLPNWCLQLSKRQLYIILQTMIEGDGSRSPRGSFDSFSYPTTSKTLSDQLHEICLKLGFALTTRTVTHEQWSTKYVSYGTRKFRHLLKVDTQASYVPYAGKVVCFTTPNGTIVTRRNGRVLISGNSDTYNRATADTSRDIADEQVFAPERARDDFLINRFILSRWGARFHTFRSNTPNITDDIELIRLMAFAERSGGMTPRRADRIVRDVFGDDIGPMPKGIDLDTPFSISFAQAQQGMRDNSGNPKRLAPAPADQQAGKLVSGLLKLRKRIEDEIEDRVLNLDEQEEVDGKAGDNEGG